MLSQNLRMARQNAGLSQMQLSKITGLPQTSISYWERGLSVPDVYQAHAIVRACGASLDDLLTEAREAAGRDHGGGNA